MANVKDISSDYQTPDYVCDYMVSLLPESSLKVLEPTPGIGNLVKSLESKGFEVDYPKDYFLERSRILKTEYDAIVCNLPFSAGSAILDNAPDHYKSKTGLNFGYKMLFEMINLSDVVIALLPWCTLTDSDVRMRFLGKNGLKSVTTLPRRAFDYIRISTCVIEVEKGYVGPVEFKVFDLLTDNKFNKPELKL